MMMKGEGFRERVEREACKTEREKLFGTKGAK